ncbi:unnamed protein product, partial [Meganyctiphanes norvegica]
VAWIYKGSGGRTVLTMGTKVVTRNTRVSIAQDNPNAWVLTISGVTKKDQGVYMCQINSKPATKEFAFLRVQVPPSIDDATSSADVTVNVGEDVTLRCDAHGDPQPTVTWRREGGKPFNNTRTVHESKVLSLSSVTPSSSGAYLCIASNDVPPAVSKRILVTVNFEPKMLTKRIMSQRMVRGGYATMDCRFRAEPLPSEGGITWRRDGGMDIAQVNTTTINTNKESMGTYVSRLTVRLLRDQDFGSYRCIVRNKLGQGETNFRVMETRTTSTTTTSTTTTTTTTTVEPGIHQWPPVITHYPPFRTPQPPFYPFYNEPSTTTTVSQNRYIAGEEPPEHSMDSSQQNGHTFTSYFGSSSSSVWCSIWHMWWWRSTVLTSSLLHSVWSL